MVQEGRLGKRGDAKIFDGAYREIVKGFNGVLDSVILPIQESAKVLDAFATGDFTERITTQYKGDHQLIVNSINKMGESVSNVLNQVKEAVAATASAANEIIFINRTDGSRCTGTICTSNRSCRCG